MAELPLDETKPYSRTDGTADDDALTSLYLPAAEKYLDAAIDHKAVLSYDVPQYRHMVLLLINHWYTNRDSVAVGTTAAEVPYMWRVLMQQLQNWGDDV